MKPEQGQEGQAAPETGSTSQGEADLRALAQATATETNQALPPGGAPGAGQGSAPAGELTDVYGRTFDPALHFARDGKPTVHPKNGKLISLPGKKPAGAVKVKAAATAGSDSTGSTLDTTGGDQAPSASGQAPVAGSEGDAQLGATPGPVVDERQAKFDAKAWRRILRMAGRWIAGPKDGEYQKTEEDDEAADVHDTAENLFIASQMRLPLGSWGPALIASGSYLARCWSSERNQERLDWLIEKMGGEKAPAKPAAPPAAPSAAAKGAPAAPAPAASANAETFVTQI